MAKKKRKKKQFSKLPNPRKWNKWINKISKEIVYVIHLLEIRKRLVVVMSNSSTCRKPHQLWYHLNNSLITSAVIRLARLTEDRPVSAKRKGVYSLIALLEEIEHHNHYFTRRRYVGYSKQPPFIVSHRGDARVLTGKEEAYFKFKRNTEFYDEFVGVNKKMLPKSRVRSDIRAIQKKSKRIRTYRNKIIAHNDTHQAKIKKLPTYDEVYELSKQLAKTVNQYHLLFKKCSTSFEPHISSLKSVLSEPWIDGAKTLSMLQEQESKKYFEEE